PSTPKQYLKIYDSELDRGEDTPPHDDVGDDDMSEVDRVGDLVDFDRFTMMIYIHGDVESMFCVYDWAVDAPANIADHGPIFYKTIFDDVVPQAGCDRQLVQFDLAKMQHTSGLGAWDGVWTLWTLWNV